MNKQRATVPDSDIALGAYQVSTAKKALRAARDAEFRRREQGHFSRAGLVRVPSRGKWRDETLAVDGYADRRQSPKGVERRAIESITGKLSGRQLRKIRKSLRHLPQEP